MAQVTKAPTIKCSLWQLKNIIAQPHYNLIAVEESTAISHCFEITTQKKGSLRQLKNIIAQSHYNLIVVEESTAISYCFKITTQMKVLITLC